MFKFDHVLTFVFDREKDTDLWEHYSPLSLLLAGDIDDLDKFCDDCNKLSDLLNKGKKFRLIIEEISDEKI